MSNHDSELEEGEINGDEGCNDTAGVGTSSSAFQDALKDIQRKKSQNQRSTLSDRNQGRYPAAYSKDTPGKSKDNRTSTLRKSTNPKRKTVRRNSRAFEEDFASREANKRLKEIEQRKARDARRLSRSCEKWEQWEDCETSRKNPRRSSYDGGNRRHTQGSSTKPSKQSDKKNNETEASDFTQKSKRVTQITQHWKTRGMDARKTTRTVSNANAANGHSPSPTHNENTPRNRERQNENDRATSNGGSVNQIGSIEPTRVRNVNGDANGDKILVKPFSNDKDEEMLEMPIVKDKPEPELIVIESSDEDEVDELELRRAALEGLYNNLENKERSGVVEENEVEEVEVEEDLATLRTRLLVDMANKSANKAQKQAAQSEKQPWKKTFKPVQTSKPYDRATRGGGRRPASGTTQKKRLSGNSTASSTREAELSQHIIPGNASIFEQQNLLSQNVASTSRSRPTATPSRSAGAINIEAEVGTYSNMQGQDGAGTSRNYGHVNVPPVTSQALVPYTPVLPVFSEMPVLERTWPPMPYMNSVPTLHRSICAPPASTSQCTPIGPLVLRNIPGNCQHPGDLAGRQLNSLDDPLMPSMTGTTDEGMGEQPSPPQRLTASEVPVASSNVHFGSIESSPESVKPVTYSISPNGTTRIWDPIENSLEIENASSTSGSSYHEYVGGCLKRYRSKINNDEPENPEENKNEPNSPLNETDLPISNVDKSLHVVTNANLGNAPDGESLVITTSMSSLNSHNATRSVNNSAEKFKKMNRNVAVSTSSSSAVPGPSSSISMPPAGVNIAIIDISTESDSGSNQSPSPPAVPLPAAPHPAPPAAVDIPVVTLSSPESGLEWIESDLEQEWIESGLVQEFIESGLEQEFIESVVDISPPTSADSSPLGGSPNSVITLSSSSSDDSSPVSTANIHATRQNSSVDMSSSTGSGISPMSSPDSTSSNRSSNSMTPVCRKVPVSKRLFEDADPNCDYPSHSRDSEIANDGTASVELPKPKHMGATSTNSPRNTTLNAVGEESHTTQPSVPHTSSGDLSASAIRSKDKSISVPSTTSQTGKSALGPANTTAHVERSSMVKGNRAKVIATAANMPQLMCVPPGKKTFFRRTLYTLKLNHFGFRLDHNRASLPVPYKESKPINPIVISLGNDSSSEEELESSAPRPKVRALANVEEGNCLSSMATVPPNFESSLEAMLKSNREKAERLKANEALRAEAFKVSAGSSDTRNKSLKELKENKDKSINNSNSKRSPDPTSAARSEKGNAEEKQKLELREKTLRAALVKQVKDSKVKMDRVQLAKAEKMLISQRGLAANEFLKLHSAMVESKDKRKLVKDCEQKIVALKKQLEKEEIRLIVEKKNANQIVVDIKSASKKAHDTRKEVVEWKNRCMEIGSKLGGPGYKVPVQGEASLHAILADIQKQLAIVKGINESNADSAPIPVASPMSATSVPSAAQPSSSMSRHVPYFIDTNPSTDIDQHFSQILVPITNFSTVLGVNEGSGGSSRVSEVLPSTFSEYHSPLNLDVSKGKK